MRRLLILGVLALLVGLLTLSGPVAAQDGCDVGVTAPDSIQAAVDANPGGAVCLDDSGGAFSQSVVFGPEDSGVTLTAAPGASPMLNGTGLGPADAIRLLAGVSGVTISGLEITGYGNAPCCGPGMAVQAWNHGTSNITVQDNYIHGNTGNAILVGNEGTGLHTGWRVRDNTISGTGFYTLELTNCQDCEIRGNTVTGGWAGIIVQARNTIPGSGLFAVEGVRVMANTVSGTSGPYIYLLGLASGPTLPFDPILGAWTSLESVMVQRNAFSGTGAQSAWVYGYLGGQVVNARFVQNSFSCAEALGIGLFGNTYNTKVVNNSFDNCNPNVIDGGDATKLPPGPF